MDLPVFVRAIMEGYSFTPERKEKLARQFTKKVEIKGIADLNEVYAYVTNTLDWQSVPGRLRYAKSLDVAVNRDSEDTLQMFFGEEDMSLDRLLNTSDAITPQEALDHLSGELDEVEYSVLRKLVEVGSFGKEINPLRLGDSVAQIKNRLKQVTRVFYTNNRIVVPRKNIEIVEAGNGKLDITIGNLDGETVAKVYEAHSSGRSPYSVGDEIGVSNNTVRTLWRAAGLESATRKEDGTKGFRSIDEEKQSKIYAAYFAGIGLYQTANKVGVSIETVLRYWRKEGLVDEKRPSPKRGYPTHSLKPDQVREIINSFERFGGNVSEAARNLPYCHTTIRNYWEAHGLKTRVKDGRSLGGKTKKII